MAVHYDNEPEYEEEEYEEEEEVEMVGYLEDAPSSYESKLLTRRNFPSKVGGKPAWLVPDGLPDAVCQTCSRPLRFLLQVYASRGEDTKSAFHRVLHLFVCTNCNPNKVVAYRAQLPRDNDYYSSEAPVAEKIAAEAHNDAELDKLVCWDCGLPDANLTARRLQQQEAEGEGVEEADAAAANRCPECARRRRNGDPPALLEERELTVGEAEAEAEVDEEDAVPSADQKDTAASDAVKTPPVAADADPDAIDAPGAENAVDDEEANASKQTSLLADADAAIAAAEAAGKDGALLQKLREYRERIVNNPDEALCNSEERVFEQWSQDQGEKDSTFSRFQRFADENQGHVLRYHYGGKPLWFADRNKLTTAPPACERCGAERIFEMQVQPQLIASLVPSDMTKRLDFGVACVYVCGANCDASCAGKPYMEEFVYVQPEPYDAWLPKGSTG